MSERTVIAGVEELRGRVGEVLGVSDWRQVSQADIDLFADVTGDHQWIHVDPERASSGPFGTTIAHGFLTLSLCAALIEQAVTLEGSGMQVNYGLDRVRFPAPVPAGSSVRGTVELAALANFDGGVQATLRVTVEAEGQSKPSCVADVLIRFYT